MSFRTPQKGTFLTFLTKMVNSPLYSLVFYQKVDKCAGFDPQGPEPPLTVIPVIPGFLEV